ncbi:uncharacterized protein LOC129569908 [Sitodiplosis mosellana]|uniref:uncharacterized protein LOC129569908 n=1 Tax=Sitodiplosis mosellana TaxID=263140 RepID=UPI002444A3B3|nr:uncharacterized protein LOC129569908 [Sitodiplosis mosellana]
MASQILHLPVHCKLFKDFLVEELIFHKSPFDFHYGKCAVIGKLCRRDNLCYLQNISLSCFDRNYCIKTGAVEIRLLPTSYRSNPGDLSSFRGLINGAFYEVHGETAFLHKDAPVTAAVPITIVEMMINLRMKYLVFTDGNSNSCNSSNQLFDLKDIPSDYCQLNETAILEDVKRFKTTHVPVLQVHTMNEIDQAEELIQCNLQLRLLRNKRHSKN